MSIQLHDHPTPASAPTDPGGGPGAAVDLTQFADLSETERMRVIIRVLCGLVALEEQEWHEDEAAPPPPRLLPFLGFERNTLDRDRSRGSRTGRRIPHLGIKRPF